MSSKSMRSALRLNYVMIKFRTKRIPNEFRIIKSCENDCSIESPLEVWSVVLHRGNDLPGDKPILA